jgi:putative flippase GtrA
VRSFTLNTRAPWDEELSSSRPGATAVAGDDWFDALFAPVPVPEGPSAIWQAPARPAPAPGAGPGEGQDRPRGLASQLPRFLAIGVASTLAYLVLYWVLRGFMPALAANALSLLVTAVANTSANRRLTFGVRGSAGAARQQVQGLIAFGAGLALSSGALAGLHAVSGTPGRTVELAVLVVANLVATMLRFVLYRLWVFGAPAAAGA